jgi:hypothetical protein
VGSVAVQGFRSETREEERRMSTSIQNSGIPRITSDEALRIARLDAETAYRDLSGYRISISFERDGWHVDYELKDQDAQGGGPHYVIDPASGKMLSKRYEQ